MSTNVYVIKLILLFGVSLNIYTIKGGGGGGGESKVAY